MRKLAIISLCLPLVAVVLVSGPSLVNGQRFAPGYCPTVAAHENFDKTKFFGNWIEVEKTPSIFDLMMRCLVVDYSDDQDNTVNVVVRGISLAGLPLTVNGDGLLQDVHRSGFYSIRYGFGVPFQGTLTTIIDTDYDDYAVVYSCTNSLLSGVFHSEYIWVLSRSGKISNPTRQNIYEKLDKLAINRSGLTMSDRSTCPANSSTVARESDKDLAGVQGATGGGAGGPASSGVSLSSPSAGGVAGSSPSDAILANGGPSATPVANLEKAGAEPTQKSVVVPLLYDLPSPVSSSSVGSNSKPSQAAASKASAAPPAPVDNKVQQLPLSAPLGQQQQSIKPSGATQAAPKPVQQSPAVASQQQQQQQVASQAQPGSQNSPASPSSSSSSSSAAAAAAAASQSASPQSAVSQNSKASQQAAAGQQQQSLMAKIQNSKP